MRNLVTIRTVSEIKPIEGADVIELALIDGWQCVVKKGEFKVGDKGLYFEIDSFIPASDERFKFLEKTFTLWKNNYGARIRTIKLRGQISQGLMLPLTSFPEITTSVLSFDKDYADQLKVVKWEREGEAEKPKQQKLTWLGRKLKKVKYTRLKPFVLWLERTFPTLLLSNATGPFPSFIPKTDEERIQNVFNKVQEQPNEGYNVTVKLDGSSMTIYRNDKRFGVCSRNLDLKRDPENKYWAVALGNGYEKALKKLNRNIAIQGELMGPGIQSNRENLTEHHYYIYKVWDIDKQRYFSYNEKLNLLWDLLALGVVAEDVPDKGIFYPEEFKTVNDYLKFAEGPSLRAPTREGVVFTKTDGTKGFKVVATSYLLKEDK